MTRAALLLALVLLALPLGLRPALATGVAEPPRAGITAPQLALPEVPRISAGHAAALGVGLFAGAVAGSALINGGALAATIGAVAGAMVGNWYWTEHRGRDD